MRYRALIFAAFVLSACGPSDGGPSDSDPSDSDPTSSNTGPTSNGNGEIGEDYAWEIVTTQYTPRVTGDSIEFVDDQTVILSDSEPGGWTVRFTSENGFVPNTFYASDDETNRVSATLEGPTDTCDVPAGADNPNLVTLQTAEFTPDEPVGAGSIAAANCFGSPAQGAIWTVAFGVVVP